MAADLAPLPTGSVEAALDAMGVPRPWNFFVGRIAAGMTGRDLTGVSIPKAHSRGRKPQYPWNTMAVGDWFVHPSQTAKVMTTTRGRRYGRRFAALVVPGGCLIVRTPDRAAGPAVAA